MLPYELTDSACVNVCDDDVERLGGLSQWTSCLICPMDLPNTVPGSVPSTDSY